MNETLLELLRHSFFQDISKKLPDFEEKFHKRIYKRDQMLIKEGEFSEGIGIIDSGLTNAFLEYHDGRSEWFCDLKKYDFFGEISMLNKQPSFLTIVCCQRIVCYFLSSDDYRFIADAFSPKVKTFFTRAPWKR
jgi:CRP-like cAMP-binding protein